MHVWFDLVLSGVFAFMIGLYRRMETLLRCRSMNLRPDQFDTYSGEQLQVTANGRSAQML